MRKSKKKVNKVEVTASSKTFLKIGTGVQLNIFIDTMINWEYKVY